MPYFMHYSKTPISSPNRLKRFVNIVLIPLYRISAVGNIMMMGRKPVWGMDCTSCLACYHVCPQHAVQYGKRTKDKGQYFNPN